MTCNPIGENRNERVRGSNRNPHPHINDSGNACLGRPLTIHLMERMRVTDIAGVIVGMSEFLSSYNRDDAWVRLSEWVPNRSDCDTCRQCGLLFGICVCISCPDCDRNIDTENMSACGSCYTCCMRRHKYIDSEELGPGLNGTQCFLR